MSRVTLAEPWRGLLAEARVQGCMVTHTRSGHIAIVTTAGRRLILPSSPSDHRAFANAVATFRRAGFRYRGR